MRIRQHLLWAGCVLMCVVPSAQESSLAPRETTAKNVVGTIRVSGDPAIAKLLNVWEEQFRSRRPDVTFDNRLTGSASAMAGLYTGVADLAFAGHELLTSESMAFEWIFHYKALPIEVTSGSLTGSNFAPAFFVSGTNPLSALTLRQADSVLGCEHRLGGNAVRTWGDFGLTGEWAGKPIHIYGYDPESEVGVFIRRKILKNSHKWNCEVKTFGNIKYHGTGQDDESQQILEALRSDPYGLAISNARYAGDDLKALSLSGSDQEPPVKISEQTIVSRQYPLTRPFFVYLNRDPGKRSDGLVSAFLRFVLSKEGQQQVVDSGTYLPLNEAVAREEAGKLE